MKALVIEALDLPTFDEAEMDAQIEYASILDGTVTFHFRNGHKVSKNYEDKRYGAKWSEERRVKVSQSMKNSWTDERRAAMSERMRQIRGEKKWPKQ